MLDGETIIAADVEIGYLHRCFEKMSETHTCQQVIPYTDRLNYCSAIINNVGYCMTVEKLLGIEAPPTRAAEPHDPLGVLAHLRPLRLHRHEPRRHAAALTNFWYLFQPREEIYGLLEACCGARLTVSACRIGGLIHRPAARLPGELPQRWST